MRSERVVVSAAEESLPLAIAQIEGEFGPGAAVEVLGPDLAVVTAPGLSARALAQRCRHAPLVFVRHLTVEAALLDPATDLAAVADAAAEALDAAGPPAPVAVQTWVSGRSGYRFGPAEVFAAVAERLTGAGFAVARSGQGRVLSCCLAPAGIVLGVNAVADSLSDWPGGQVRLARRRDQVSRAEFKLEEAIGVFGLSLPSGGSAVDFGAAPGGWTRILRRHGMRVWAVDPGRLDAAVAADRGVRHRAVTAGRFLEGGREVFDVAVNDMRMDPVRSCDLMAAAAPRLRSGALVVVTLKTGTRRVLETVDTCLRRLSGPFEVVHARQLRHNRHEVTVVARNRAGGRR